jgi:hypothetical protein
VPKRHHIQRIENRRCWSVEAKRSPLRIRKYFHDRRYGSKRAALAEAIAYRDRLLAKVPKWGVHQRSSKNKSGVIGVGLVERRFSGRVHRFWTATWKENGRSCARSFSVAVHGSRRAKALAVALRREKVAAARPEPPPLPRKPLSSTGILGVFRRVIAGAPVYVAAWREHGRCRQRCFSTKRYGKAKALALAVRARRENQQPRPLP